MDISLRDQISFIRQNGYFKYPRTFQLEITRECPFNCPQCYKVELGEKHMSLSSIRTYIKEAQEHHVLMMVLNGGEPLLHPNFVQILQTIRECATFEVNCFTSGYGLTDNIIAEMKQNSRFHLYISLNGSTDEINSYSRQGFSCSIKAMQHLQEADCSFGVNWVARHDNVHDFPAMVDLCERLGADTLSVTSNKLIHDKKHVSSQIDANDIEYLRQELEHHRKILITVESCFPQLTARFKKLGPMDGCAAGVYNLNIAVDGSFMPCTHLYYPEKWDSIESYWTQSPTLAKLRECAKCNLCDYRCRYCKAMSPHGYNEFSLGMQECFWRK